MFKLRIRDATTKVVYVVEVTKFVYDNLKDKQLEYYREKHFLRVKFETKHCSSSVPFDLYPDLQGCLWKIAYNTYLNHR